MKMMLFLFDQYCQRLVNFITFFEELTLDLLILCCMFIHKFTVHKLIPSLTISCLWGRFVSHLS